MKQPRRWVLIQMRIVFVMCVNMGYCKTGSVIDCHACPAADINLSVSSHTSGAGLLRPKPTLCLYAKLLRSKPPTLCLHTVVNHLHYAYIPRYYNADIFKQMSEMSLLLVCGTFAPFDGLAQCVSWSGASLSWTAVAFSLSVLLLVLAVPPPSRRVREEERRLRGLSRNFAASCSSSRKGFSGRSRKGF